MIGPKTIIVIERESKISDGAGGFDSTWAKLVSLKGVLLPLVSREKFVSDSIKSISTHYFQCRYSNYVITTADRVLYNSEYYDITYADNCVERNILLILYLKKSK